MLYLRQASTPQAKQQRDGEHNTGLQPTAAGAIMRPPQLKPDVMPHDQDVRSTLRGRMLTDRA
jgi:hypothetical protein